MASKFAREEEEYNYSCDSADESECGDVPDEDVEDHDTSCRGGPCSVQDLEKCPGCGQWKQLYTHHAIWTCQKTHRLCNDCNQKQYCPIDPGHPRVQRYTNDESPSCTVL